jgi:hypothetical protein
MYSACCPHPPPPAPIHCFRSRTLGHCQSTFISTIPIIWNALLFRNACAPVIYLYLYISVQTLPACRTGLPENDVQRHYGIDRHQPASQPAVSGPSCSSSTIYTTTEYYYDDHYSYLLLPPTKYYFPRTDTQTFQTAQILSRTVDST